MQSEKDDIRPSQQFRSTITPPLPICTPTVALQPDKLNKMVSLPHDQRTMIETVRGAILGAKSSLSVGQKKSLETANIDVPWTAKTTFPAPEDERGGIKDLIDEAFEKYGGGDESYFQPSVDPVDAWWTTYDDGGDYPDNTSGHERYNQVLRSIDSDVVVMYFHGGGFYKNSPMTYLPALQRISKMTGFRTFTPRYRLSPQNPFPAAIYDASLAYLALLYPPPGSLHGPLDPSKIIFAGDSAGANLALAVLQVIKSSESHNVSFHGSQQKLFLPAGVTLLSAGLEQTWALPSVQKYVKNDIFGLSPSWLNSSYPHDLIWPSNPPRANVYGERSILDHPLAAPCMQSDWSWSPPMWFLGGQEIFRDSAAGVAETAAQQGVNVEYLEFEDMPHDFHLWSVIAPQANTDNWPQTKNAWRRWAKAFQKLGRGECLENKASIIKTGGEEVPLDRMALLGYTFDDRVEIIRAKATSMPAYV